MADQIEVVIHAYKRIWTIFWLLMMKEEVFVFDLGYQKNLHDTVI